MKKQNEGVIPFLKTLSCPEVKLIIDKNWSFIFIQIISNELPIEKNTILYILLYLNEKLSLNTNICFFISLYIQLNVILLHFVFWPAEPWHLK